MKNLAPDILRQRLLIEGFYTIDVTKEILEKYLYEIANYLNLRTYGEPTIFSPSGMGKEENAGFDAFIPLIDSGISVYVWSKRKFVSIILYTCKNFDALKAIEFTQQYFDIKSEIESLQF